MRLLWKMWVDAGTEGKALKLCGRVLERMGRGASGKRVEPYPKTGGFVVSFAVALEHAGWNDAVVEAIALGQRVGHGWVLSGAVEDDPGGRSNRTNVAGVESVEWALVKSDAEEECQWGAYSQGALTASGGDYARLKSTPSAASIEGAC